jgi:hypothetical protein
MNKTINSEYNIYFSKFYKDLFLYQSGSKSQLKCKDCSQNKRFIFTNDNKFIFSCGPKNDKKCGKQYEIILPEYINFQEFKDNFNKKINGSFDYIENNRLEYDLNSLSKNLSIQDSLQEQTKIINDSKKQLNSLIDDFIKLNNIEDRIKSINDLSDKRYKNLIEKKKIFNSLLYHNLPEHEKKFERIKYAKLIKEDQELQDTIKLLQNPDSNYIMISNPKIIKYGDITKVIEQEVKQEDKIEVKQETPVFFEEEVLKPKYSFKDQVKILTEFYQKADPDKTKEEIINIVQRRRPKGTPKNTRIPTKPWLELCNKLHKKYNIDPLDIEPKTPKDKSSFWEGDDPRNK